MRRTNFKAKITKQFISYLLVLIVIFSNGFFCQVSYAEIDLNAKYGYCRYPLNVREEMSITSKWISQYPAQSTIHLLEDLGDWYKVENGYVKKEFVLDEIEVYMYVVADMMAIIYEEPSFTSKVLSNTLPESEYLVVSKKNGFMQLESGGWAYEGVFKPQENVIAQEERQYTLEDMNYNNMQTLTIQAIGHIEKRTKSQGVTTKKALYFQGDIPIYGIINDYAYFPSGRNIYRMSIDKFTEFVTVNANAQVLDAYRTIYYSSSNGRKTNIELVSDILDGTVIQPKETFSYNQTTGTRSASRGYQIAKVIVNGEYVDGYGGGVCQVSSTIYAAIMHDPNITVKERRAHGLEVTYLPYGMDATVSYGSIDLKFTNHYPFAVVLNVKSKDGVCLVTLTKQE